VNEQLDDLTPEDRALVMQDARVREMLAEHEKKVLQRVEGPLQEMREREFQRELVRLAQKYPGYNHDIHSEQVRGFMEKNQSTTPEQAFRAIAADDVLFIRPVSQATEERPQFIPPKGTAGTENYVPPPKEDPDENLRKKTREVHKLARVTDPDAQREHRKALDGLVRERLFGGG
jgi:hypothetical protein